MNISLFISVTRFCSLISMCVCVCVCVCTGFCGLRGQNLFNNMGMTEVLQFEGVL